MPWSVFLLFPFYTQFLDSWKLWVYRTRCTLGSYFKAEYYGMHYHENNSKLCFYIILCTLYSEDIIGTREQTNLIKDTVFLLP